MKYDIFKTKHQIIFSNKKMMKFFGEMLEKKNIDYKDFYLHDSKYAISIDDTLAANVNAEEMFWLENGKQIVFVSDQIANMLQRSKLSTNKNAQILSNDGLNSFALCFPKNFSMNVNGNNVIVPSCLVTVMKARDIKTKIHKPFGDFTKCKILMERDDEEVMISFLYNLNTVTFRGSVPLSELMDRLSTGIVENVQSSLFYDQHLNEEEKAISNNLLKIIVSFLIYNNATDNKYLVKGYPSKVQFDKPKSRTEQYNNSYWTSYHVIDYRPKSSVTAHIRASHFRNLQHEKYYRNEYSDIPRGSRWTLVSESYIGDHDTYLQTVEKE
ncbi:TPA: hypothetical protein ACX6S1_003831 [Photobacterium damselae]